MLPAKQGIKLRRKAVFSAPAEKQSAAVNFLSRRERCKPPRNETLKRKYKFCAGQIRLFRNNSLSLRTLKETIRQMNLEILNILDKADIKHERIVLKANDDCNAWPYKAETVKREN